MSLPMRLFALLFIFGIVLSPVAQERTAASPQAAQGAAAARETALLQKVSYLTQLVKILETQLQACAAGQGITCPSVLAANVTSAQTAESAPAPTSTYTAASQPVVTPSVPAPARRHTIGYQQASESRLGCDDYSLSYFRRHPAMAAVCGVNAQLQAPAAPAQQPSALPEEDEDAHDPQTTPAPARP